jgi:hypothetical protein
MDDPSRPFQQFLQPELMAAEKRSGIASEMQFDLRDRPKTVVKWDELGKLGGHRVRRIEYFLAPTPEPEDQRKFAGFVVIEQSPGIFAQLFKWSGDFPPPAFFRTGNTDVLVIERDFGGNVPMVMTWAWVWTAQGPMRVEVEKAVQEAIEKVAPGHAGYSTGINWSDLHTETYSWGPGGYPGKVGVEETVNAWFDLRGNRLTVKRVEWKKSFDENAPVKRWP